MHRVHQLLSVQGGGRREDLSVVWAWARANRTLCSCRPKGSQRCLGPAATTPGWKTRAAPWHC